MKLIKAGLLDNVVGSYDQTKTTTQGRVSQKTISGDDYLGPPLSKFNDLITDLALTPSGPIFKKSNNRVFVPFLVVAGTFGVALYNHNATTNSNTYIGQIRFSIPNTAATTHTIRAFKVIDTGTTGWKIFISTTGSVLFNGATFLVNSVDLADFIASPPTFGFATGNDQKAVYKLHDNNSVMSASTTITVASPGKVNYVSHPFHVNDPVIFIYGTLPTGLALNTTYYVRNPSANDFELSATVGGASINTTGAGGTAQISGVYYQTSIAGSILDLSGNKLYVHNGVAATHQYHVYNTNTAPTYSKQSALVVDDVGDTIQYTAHPFQNNDPIFITDLVGGTGLTNNTNYFVRNATANTFQLSATSGGAVINITVAGTASVGRSFGTTSALFSHKTANLPALTGTLLASDSEDFAQPQHTTNSGFNCAFFATTINLYLGRLSELTAGATTWASLVTSNLLGTTNQITAPTASLATWSNVLDSAFFITNASIIIQKKVVNNQLEYIFGGVSNNFYEAFSIPETVELEGLSFTGMDVEDGVLFMIGSTTGQRGLFTVDLRSDSVHDYSYMVTPVLNTPSAVYKVVTSVEALFEKTGNIKVQYRTSGFGSISGGWTNVTSFSDLSGLATGAQVQFKILFNMQSEGSSTPAQVSELYLGYSTITESSENWEFSDDNSVNTVPSRIAYRLKNVYATSVPTLYFRAHDLSDTLLTTKNTVTNVSEFEYSTDNGFTWLPLGTIPNTVGTLVRYSLPSGFGVDIRPSIKEE